MFSFLKKWLGSSEPVLTKKQIEKQQFEADNGISYHIGFACHGLLVREFNHHLRFYSNNTVDDFDAIGKIMIHKEMILNKIESAIAENDVAEKGLIEDETALMNAQNFLKIFKTVVEYNSRFNPDFYYLK